eukprot:scaffold131006_cov69-Phaeocystis_antarctica.AAC.4
MRRPPRPRPRSASVVVPTLVAARFARPRLLLRALHALAAATLLVVVLLGIGQGCQVLVERLDGVNALEDADVNVVRVLRDGGHVLRGRQRLHERLGGGGVELGGELDLHDDEEVAELEGRLEARQPLAFARLHHPARGGLVRVADDVELAALGRLLGGHGLGVRALLEDGLAVLHDEAADALALELALLARLLAHVDVLRLRHRGVLERRHVAVHVRVPLAHLLLGKRVVRGRRDALARAGFDQQLPAVEVLQLHGEAAQGLGERDGALNVQVVSLALELCVRLLLANKDDIARLAVGDLVRLLREGELVPVRRALRNVHLQRLLHLLLAVDGAVAAARVADLLHLLDHRAHPDGLNLGATPAAAGAGLHALVLIDDLPRQAQRARAPLVDLLQRHLQRVHHVLALLDTLRSPSAAPAREHIEDVAAAAAAAAAALQALLAVLVVDVTLLLVAQAVEGLLDLLELLKVAALVGVILHGELAVGLLDRVGRLVLRHAEDVVELLRVRLLAGAPAPAHAGHAAHAGHGILKTRGQPTKEHI